MPQENIENLLELPISVQQVIVSNNYIESMKIIRQIVFVFMAWVSVVLVAVGWYLWEYSYEEVIEETETVEYAIEQSSDDNSYSNMKDVNIDMGDVYYGEQEHSQENSNEDKIHN